MDAALLSGLLAGYGIAMPVGAIAIFLIRLGATAFRRYRSANGVPRARLALRTPLRAYTTVAAVTVVNPLTVIYWAALVLGRQASAAAFTPTEAAAFAAAVFAASASWQTVLVSGGALIGRVATSRRAMLATSLASSLLIAGIATHLLLR